MYSNDDIMRLLKRGGFSLPDKASLFQSFANKYRKKYCNNRARPLYKGEYHWKCHNFSGPGTRINLPNVANYPPYNKIDLCSKHHDLDYMRSSELPDEERKKAIRQADKKVLNCYSQYKNEDGYKPSMLGINSKIAIEKVLPMIAKPMFKRFRGGIINFNIYTKKQLFSIIKDYNSKLCLKKYSRLNKKQLSTYFSNNFNIIDSDIYYKYGLQIPFKKQKLTKKFMLKVIRKYRELECIKQYSKKKKKLLINLVQNKYKIQVDRKGNFISLFEKDIKIKQPKLKKSITVGQVASKPLLNFL